MVGVERVGVVVVDWEQPELTAECLRSVRADDPGCLAILVENGSRPQLADEAAAAAPGAAVLRLRDNHGYAAGCNAGAAEAIRQGATHLLLLNNDATVEPGAIAALLEAGRRHPDAILAPLIVFADRPDTVWSAGGTVARPWMLNAHLGEGEPAAVPREERRLDWATGCALFLSVDIYRRLGPMEESFFLFLEDLDWGLRAASLGLETRLVPSAVVRHRVSRSTGLLPPPQVLYYGCRNTYRLSWRHGDWATRAWMGPVVLWTLAKIGLRNLLQPSRRRDPAYRARSRAVLDFVLGRRGRTSWRPPA